MTRLDWASASAGQLWDDPSDAAVIENNGVAPKWGCSLFQSEQHR